MNAPVAVDLCCGLGGWTEGLLAEGYRVIGIDIERHEYGDHKYPADLVLMDVRDIHGSWFKDVTLIVASPPCQAYSYRAMPWKRAKALPPPDNTLFESCFRIQREACEAAGRYIPMVVENVRGAQKWVGQAKHTSDRSICGAMCQNFRRRRRPSRFLHSTEAEERTSAKVRGSRRGIAMAGRSAAIGSAPAKTVLCNGERVQNPVSGNWLRL